MTESIRLFRGRFGHVSLLNVCSNLVTHAHPELHMIIWVAGAPGQMTVGSDTVDLEPGIAVGINSFQPHAHVFAEHETPGSFLAFYIDLEWLTARRKLPAGAPVFASPAIPLSPFLSESAQHFTDLLSGGEEDYELIAYELERYIDHLIDAADAARSAKTSAENVRLARDFRIRKAIALMEANVGERVCFDKVARSVGLSRPHFFALFKEHMNVTPNVYWNTLRIAEARRCLQSSDEPLISLAYSLGFTSQGNFSRFFREHTGVRPTVYRSALSESLHGGSDPQDSEPSRERLCP
ncbi:AraC family transcriptional regulator [Rhizobiaceae bacterium n13]|uniref:AraC family transcriptional regulator n=1 Tax=Ferirhizobium litorale TaxID=2927786 RepID=A0AAE3QFA1_9HYPH|nr:AraC family transcriptional regulator [Fererhizobium litorale]MDI7861635.1 AraC family transcriptional regulator [Fererhizobium litorale]MDI7922023.1 AraC family transcriptional regulator [Fererhizobium litorale]